ncbi:basic amino acid/polyamine antiporter, APA family [Alphaproteobacteria bacterium]
MNFGRYFQCKTIDKIVSEAENSGLKRSLNAIQLIMLGIGAIIGAGIFVMTGAAASQSAGPAVVLSFVFSGFACMCAGLCYAELSSTIPVSGSSYTYIYATLGELSAWVVACLMIFGNILIISSVANGWSGYAMSFLADFGVHISPIWTNTMGKLVYLRDGSEATALFNVPAFFIVAVIAYILYHGIRTSAAVNSITVVVKMSVLVAFVLFGIFKIDLNNWVPFIPENTGDFGRFGWSGILGGASMVFVAYNGFDTVATAAQETKNPQRDLPIGILGALLVCTVTYTLVSIVLTGLVNYKDLDVAQPIALAVDKMNMPWFALVVKIGALAGLTSVVLVMSYAVIRTIYVVTQDGLLPKRLADCHNEHHTPHIATVTLGTIIAFIAAILPLEQLVQLGNLCIISIFAVVCFGALYLHYKEPNVHRPFKCPFMPWVPIVGIVLLASIMVSMLDKRVYAYFSILLALSVVFYFLYGRHFSVLQKELRAEIGIEN